MLENSARIIKHKVDLLNLAEEQGNVSKACKVMGLSRDMFYRYKAAVESGGIENLFDKSRRQSVRARTPGRRVVEKRVVHFSGFNRRQLAISRSTSSGGRG